MAFISSKSAAYLRSSFLFIIAFYLVKDPSVVTEQPFIIILGQAMQMEHGALNTLDNYNNLLAAGFALLGLLDIFPILNNRPSYFHTMPIARVSLAFLVTGYSLINPKTILRNDLVFVFGLFEIWTNFLLHNVVKQEEHELAKKLEEKFAKTVNQKDLMGTIEEE